MHEAYNLFYRILRRNIDDRRMHQVSDNDLPFLFSFIKSYEDFPDRRKPGVHISRFYACYERLAYSCPFRQVALGKSELIPPFFKIFGCWKLHTYYR